VWTINLRYNPRYPAELSIVVTTYFCESCDFGLWQPRISCFEIPEKGIGGDFVALLFAMTSF
jgi:hypothetical protein